MANEAHVSNACKTISVVSVLYIGSGLVNGMMSASILFIMIPVYVAFFAVSLAAVVASFVWNIETYRPLAKWCLIPMIPIFGTNGWLVKFPGVVSVPLHISISFGSGDIIAGVDFVPILLLVLLSVFIKKAAKASAPAQQEQQEPQEQEEQL